MAYMVWSWKCDRSDRRMSTQWHIHRKARHGWAVLSLMKETFYETWENSMFLCMPQKEELGEFLVRSLKENSLRVKLQLLVFAQSTFACKLGESFANFLSLIWGRLRHSHEFVPLRFLTYLCPRRQCPFTQNSPTLYTYQYIYYVTDNSCRDRWLRN